ncbi:MAG: 1-acyl-sn-glycerol-3-phosphate acyltransferase [Neisseriaceae bacterium]|nr:1-acyl-sn-glycerol-3-phosphate acyltransferase [Neisseriaceae bacterium PsAf]MCV2502810.1 1-acyl-sn-glycerol-3-phosphate acyltransferase [Neisseriaceae bacterium]MCV2509172.1 1-acyl-sn-glycerol-3-phosphate acyltransferase [Neisseriaceae bacterium]
MAVIRSLLLWLVFAPFTIIWFIPVLFSVVLPPRQRHKFGAFWNATFVFLIDKIVGLRYEVEGLENVPDEPTIICCKHQSGYETLALQRFLPDQVFIIKKELLWFPIVGISLYIMNSIPIDRNKKSPQTMEKLIKTARKRKEDGFWINIFPEGTRVEPGERGKYRYGAANMAQALEMNILPVATNSGEFWPKGLIKYPGRAKFIIGKPISYQIGDSKEIMHQCEEWIESQQLKITGEGPFGPKKIK